MTDMIRIFSIKDTKLDDSVVTLTERDAQNYQNFLVKDFKDQFIETIRKQKARLKLQQINLAIFWNQILLE